MFGELKHDMTNMKNEIRQEWKQDLRQEMSTIRQDVSSLRQEHHTSLRNLEVQVAQNSKALTERPQGSLPSTTVNNPRERAQAVTLRSGKELPEPILKKSTSPKSPIEEEIVEETLEEDKGQEKEEPSPPLSSKATQAQDKGKEKVDLPMYQPPLPFPGRVRKNIDTTQYGSQQGKSKGPTKNRKKASLAKNPAWTPGRTRVRPASSSPRAESINSGRLEDARPEGVRRGSLGESEDETRGFKPNPSLSSSFTRTKHTPKLPPSKFFKFHPSLRPKIKAFFFSKAFNKQVKMPTNTRSKERAKKTRHDREASSSRAPQGVSDLIAPGGRGLPHLTEKQRERVEELQQKGVSGGFYFDYTMLDAYGCREEVEQMMRRPYWERLFNWREDTYEPVVHEFVATFEPVPSSHSCTPCMKFNLFGRGYQLSIIQLGERLGLYTHQETMSEEWLNLPTDFDSDDAVEAYWSRITDGRGGRFTGIKQSTSKITIPSLKMMKLLLNLTFGGRTKNLHKVYRFDLFHLWSLEMNEPIQMAHMVLQMFHSQKNAKCPYVWIGPVVTRLCHGLGLQGELAREKVIATMQPFNDAHLSRSYVRRIGDMPRPPREEPQQEPVVEGGQDVPPEYADYPPVHDWASMRALQIQLHTHSMDTFNRRMDLQHEEMMRHNEAIMRHNEAILRQNEAIERQREAYARQEERQQQQVDAIEQLRLWMEHRFPPPSQGGDGFVLSINQQEGRKEYTNGQRIGKKHTKRMKQRWKTAKPRAGRAGDARPPGVQQQREAELQNQRALCWTRLGGRASSRGVRSTVLKDPRAFLSSILLLPLQGIPRTEMMVPRHTLERGESSGGNHDDSSSEEGEGYGMEFANRGLMLQVEDLFRFRHFRAKEIIEWCYVDTHTLEALGIRREYERIVAQPFWREICNWRDATYTPIVREFVATLEVNEEVRDRRFPSIKFKLFNKEYDVSSDALGNLLGFYTLADQDQAWYADLVDDFESELQEDLFWWSIARPGVTWQASYTSARYIKVPELLILWHIVARSWLGRRTRNDNITRYELFILWSMYTQTPVHMGEICKRILRRQSFEDSENIFIGPFVSRLAEALGFEEILSQEVITTTMRPIDMEECMHLGLRFNDTMEETRESELLDTIRRLEHRVDVLELEVRRIILDRQGEEPFELGEGSIAPR
nr:uncharacterized protein LOC109154451 [Ipomoea trifida]